MIIRVLALFAAAAAATLGVSTGTTAVALHHGAAAAVPVLTVGLLCVAIPLAIALVRVLSPASRPVDEGQLDVRPDPQGLRAWRVCDGGGARGRSAGAGLADDRQASRTVPLGERAFLVICLLAASVVVPFLVTQVRILGGA
jgi:hypothetical protein